MKINSTQFLYKTLIILLVSSLFSCSTEYLVHKSFKRKNEYNLLIIPNNTVLKTNGKIKELYPNFAQLPEDLQDTIWNAQSIFLDANSDSVLTKKVYNSLLNRLQNTNLKTYTANKESEFPYSAENSYILKVAQLELEEDVKQVPFIYPLNEFEELYKEVEINTLDLNIWFEVSKANSEDKALILYAQKTIGDKVNGRFYQAFNGEYKFEYSKTEITEESALMLAQQGGYAFAQYIYDYFLNKYEAEILKPRNPSQRYFGYTIETPSFMNLYYPDENQRLIEIKTK